MNQSKATHFLDFPYEIYASIFKYAFLDDARALACTCKQMNFMYRELNTHMSDKIIFNSKRDNFEKYMHVTNLKEIIMHYSPGKVNYAQCIKFCLRQKHIEKIVIIGIIYDGTSPVYECRYPTLERLTDLTLDFLTASREDGNYLLPFVKNIVTLSRLTVRNSMLNQETMVALSNNEHMSYMSLENVAVFHKLYLRNMLKKMRNIRTLSFVHLQFTRLMHVMRTVEELFDATVYMPKLKDLKVSVWQEFGSTYHRATTGYERINNTFKLSRGNSISFFRAMVPLINTFRLSEFELIYINNYMPETDFEQTLMKYKIADDETCCAKYYTYITE